MVPSHYHNMLRNTTQHSHHSQNRQFQPETNSQSSQKKYTSAEAGRVGKLCRLGGLLPWGRSAQVLTAQSFAGLASDK